MIQHPIGTVVKLTDLTNYQSCINRIRSSPPPYRITVGELDEISPDTKLLQEPDGKLSIDSNQQLHQNLDISKSRIENSSNFRNDLQQIEHDVRSATSIILGYAELIDSGDLGETTPNQKKAAQAIANKSQALKNSLNKISLYAALITGSYMWLDFELDQLLLNSFSEFQKIGDASQVSIRKNILVQEGWVQGDPELVRAAILCLVENAARMSPPKYAIWLILSKKGKYFDLAIVADEDNFFPPDIYNKTQCKAGSMSDFHDLHGNTGVDISLAREIIETFGGKLTILRQPGFGVCFHVYLPNQLLD